MQFVYLICAQFSSGWMINIGSNFNIKQKYLLRNFLKFLNLIFSKFWYKKVFDCAIRNGSAEMYFWIYSGTAARDIYSTTLANELIFPPSLQLYISTLVFFATWLLVTNSNVSLRDSYVQLTKPGAPRRLYQSSQSSSSGTMPSFYHFPSQVGGIGPDKRLQLACLKTIFDIVGSLLKCDTPQDEPTIRYIAGIEKNQNVLIFVPN